MLEMDVLGLSQPCRQTIRSYWCLDDPKIVASLVSLYVSKWVLEM